MRLVDRQPHLTADELVTRFTPPPRFATAKFATYKPDNRFPTQAAALQRLTHYSTDVAQPARRWSIRKTTQQTKGLYLDGGYGVGKTHLLAALWYAWPSTKAYMTFTELTAFIGFSGMTKAVSAFKSFDLICIDEFELDDVANTLMVVSLLRSLATKHGLRIAVTSNTLPDRLGEQRFSAADFRREIAAIASYFDELRIDGEDFRAAHGAEPISLAHPLTDDSLNLHDDFDALLHHLRKVHPVQYGAMLDGVDSVTINNAHTITEQDDALLFVQLVDKLYDANITVVVNGCEADKLFDATYRLGGYRKKYGRAESRLAAMARESR